MEELDLYRQMIRIRAVEERIAVLYADGEMRCPVHLCTGQEAVPAGVCGALESSDKVLGAHRSHGHYLAKGGSMDRMLAELYGKATGCAGGKGGSMHLVDLDAGFVAATPIVGSTIAIAAGVAFAAVMRSEPTVVVNFFGDAATEQGIFHESLAFAALKRLPMVFVCENNLFSVNSPLDVRQAAGRDLLGIARANGIAAAGGDGNDVREVYTIAREAVERARRDGGPTLLEFETYRWREHCGPLFDDADIRPADQLATWRKRDPIATSRRRLLEGGTRADELERIAARVNDEVEHAVRFAKDSPLPAPDEFDSHVYAS